MAEQETVRITVEEAERLDQEIARLREELSRAAAREDRVRAWTVTTLQQIAILGSEPLVPRERKDPPEDLWREVACQGLLDALAAPSPLAEAAQEVLEAYPPALGLLLNFKHFCEHETGDHCNDPDAECPIAMGEWWESEERETFERAMTAHKRFRALLEGREEG